MIEVIEQKKYICTCDTCESKLKYERSDIRNVQTGMNEYDKEIDCPVCGSAIRLFIVRKEVQND